MMGKDLQIFDFNEQAVRVIVREDGERWWVAKDVCNVLELSNVSEALKMLEDEEKSSLRISEGTSPEGGNPNFNVISESGLYTLITRSNKPEAKKFRKWVTSEVLPSICKTGSYTIKGAAEPAEESKPSYPMIEEMKKLIEDAKNSYVPEETIAALYMKLADEIAECNSTEQMRRRCIIAGESGEKVGIIYQIIPDRASDNFLKKAV